MDPEEDSMSVPTCPGDGVPREGTQSVQVVRDRTEEEGGLILLLEHPAQLVEKPPVDFVKHNPANLPGVPIITGQRKYLPQETRDRGHWEPQRQTNKSE